MLSKINNKFTYLSELEAEAIFILREVAAQFKFSVLLFSGGKDSIVASYLAYKAFYPGPIPFPFLHIDTGQNFSETIQFRDEWMRKLGVNLMIGSVEDTIQKGYVSEDLHNPASRNVIQSVTLMRMINDSNIDALIGGGRRDEEKARSKERIFSHRDSLGQWNPSLQRAEIWQLYNGKKNYGEHFRVFPLSNWTEMDIWEYIKKEYIPLPSLYFAHKRDIIRRNGIIYAVSPYLPIKIDEKIENINVRFRTCGDMPITGAIESRADTIDKIIKELPTLTTSERGQRVDDKTSPHAMEERKKNGYF